MPTAALGAQGIHGIIRDSIGHQPIAGVVVTLLDSSRAAIHRTLTTERGEFTLPSSPAIVQIRLQRLGYRLREIDMLPASAAGRLEIVMVALPSLLDPVKVVADPRCARRKDYEMAQALLQQGRAGLLNIIVARESNPGRFVRIAYERRLKPASPGGAGDRIESQAVRIDSSGESSVSFRAARAGANFVENGFRADSAGKRFYFGPDAETLLDDGFAAGYCFRIADSDRRPNQVGLAFAASSKRAERVDIEGTLWIDTVARTLSEITFRYVGLTPIEELIHPGGLTAFREMPNGVVVVDRWLLRLVVAMTDTLRSSRGVQVVKSWSATEGGGELVRARWPDGTTWHASLGTVRGHADYIDRASNANAMLRRPSPAALAVARLKNTDYAAVVDSNGDFEIRDVLPGPYSLVVLDPRLATIGIDAPIVMELEAKRDSVVGGRVRIKTAHDLIVDLCKHAMIGDDMGVAFIGQVVTPTGEPVKGVRVRVIPEVSPLYVDIVTGTDGAFPVCLESSRLHSNLGLRIRVDDGPVLERLVPIDDFLLVKRFVVEIRK